MGDAEGDGDLDVAVGRETHFDEVYLNDGSGGFPGKLPFDPIWEKTWDVAWGDVDGDDDLDLALGNSYRSTVIYSNEPVISSPGLALTRPIAFGAGVYRSLSVAFGDVDRDCDLDLATTRDGGQNVIYLNSSLGCHVYPPIFMNSYPSP